MEAVDSVGRLALHAAGTALTRAQLVQQHAMEQEYFEQMQEVQQNVHDSFMGFIPWIQRIVKLAIVTFLLLMSSLLLYGLMYVIIMPGHHTMEHLYFDYTCRGDGGQPVCEATETGIINCETVDISTRKCSPAATVDLFARQDPWQAYEADVVPSPVTQSRILKSQHHYMVETALVMPESTVNLESGMFGVSVELASSNNTILASSIRSIRLPHESLWIGFIRKTLCLGPLLMGALTEARTVVVPSFRHYVESADYPLRYVTVQLLARGNAWQDATPVEVISGEVRIGKELNALQGVLREWFYTCYAMGTLTIFMFQAFFWALFGKNVERERERGRQTLEEWEAGLEREMADHGAGHWEAVPGEDDDEWDDLPTDGQQESDRPVTPDHPHNNEDETGHVEGTAEEIPAEEEPLLPGRTEERSSEDVRAARVIRGQTDPYEVFTDHDDPDL